MTGMTNVSRIGKYVYYYPPLARGSFSKVFQGINLEDNSPVAIKKISYDKIHQKILSRVKREIDILKSCKHPHILAYIDHFYCRKAIYIVTELCTGGTFSDVYINNSVTVTEQEIKLLMNQLKEALMYLYKKEIFHRDIKPQNILLSKDVQDQLNVKLADFGMASCFNEEQVVCGSPLYMSYELLVHKKFHPRSDLWSIGIILFRLLYGYFPFGKPATSKSLIENIKTSEYALENAFIQEEMDEGKTVVAKLLQKDPENRMDWEEFFSHTWFHPIPPQEIDCSLVVYMKKVMSRRETERKNIEFVTQGDTERRLYNSFSVIENFYPEYPVFLTIDHRIKTSAVKIKSRYNLEIIKNAIKKMTTFS